jgi:hypothetical protein
MALTKKDVVDQVQNQLGFQKNKSCPNRQLMAQRNRENGVTLPSVKSNFTERSESHDKEKEKTVGRGEESLPGMGLSDRVPVKGRKVVLGRRV